MKNLQTLCERVRIPLRTHHYLSFLNTPEGQKILASALQKSQTDQLSLLQYIVLKVIRQCQQWDCLRGETAWQTAAAACIAQLKSRKWNRRRRLIWLHQVDDLVEIACVTQAVRQDIWETAQQRASLSEEQNRQYSAIRQVYREQQYAIVDLEDQVNQIGKTYTQLTGQSLPPLSSTGHGITQTTPQELPKYHTESVQIRFSETHIKHLIHVEDNARIVYRDLSKELLQKPKLEKIVTEICSAKKKLDTKAKKLMNTARKWQEKIQKDLQFLVTHRNQSLLAHENRIQQLSTSLEQIIQKLEMHLSHHLSQPKWFQKNQYRTLSDALNEAKAARLHLNQAPEAINADVLHHQLLKIEENRRQYEGTLTGWAGFFSLGSSKRRQTTLNHDLQTHIAKTVTPLCGLHDRQGVITPDQIQGRRSAIRQLEVKQNQISTEHGKIQGLKENLSSSLTP